MAGVVLIASFGIKVFAIIVLLASFKTLAVPEEMRKGTDFLTKYYLMRKNYRLLRMSLLFLAALAGLELLSMAYVQFAGGSPYNDALLLFTDAVLTGLILLLSHIYRVKKISDAELKYLSQK